MGATVAVFAAQAITAIVVSKVATAVLTELGVDEDIAGVVGMVAAVYAGGYVGNQVSAANAANATVTTSSAAPPGEVIADTAAGGAGLTTQAPTAGTGMAGEGSALVSTSGSELVSTPNAPVGSASNSLVTPAASESVVAPGASESVIGDTGMTTTNLSTPNGVETTVGVGTGGGGIVPPPEPTWYEQLWDSDRLGDVLGGVAQGGASGMLAADSQQELERARLREKKRLEYKGDVEFPTLSPNYRRELPTTTTPRPRQLMRRQT